MSDKIITIYTDGACSGNPGRFAPDAAKLHGRVRRMRLRRFAPGDSARKRKLKSVVYV